MDKYTQLLEFFMENGVQLDREQMEELKIVCESKNSGVASRLIKDRAEKTDKLIRKANALENIGSKPAKEKAAKVRNQADRQNFVRFKNDNHDVNGYSATRLRDDQNITHTSLRDVKDVKKILWTG